MPVKPTSSETEQDFIGRCMSEEKDSFPDNTQRYAVCKSKWDESLSEVSLEEEDIQAIYDRLPAVEKGEMEDVYVERCIPTLYPSDYDQQQAASFCADHYSNRVTIGLKETNLSTMKAQPLSDFDRNKLEFQAMIAMKELREKGINLAPQGEGYTPYPWDECIKDQEARYGDKETAKSICGYIKSKYGH